MRNPTNKLSGTVSKYQIQIKAYHQNMEVEKLLTF